jgi:hypothetical protein
MKRRPSLRATLTAAAQGLRVGGVLLLLLAACAPSRELSKTSRTTTEQLLLSQALHRSLSSVSIPLPDGSSVAVEPVALKDTDAVFARELVASRLASLGLRVQKKEEEANYLVRVIVQTLGTNQETSFFGMPPVRSVLLPFALPELPVYKHEHQQAAVRLRLEIFERATRRFITSTRWYEGLTYFDHYTLLFFIGFHVTDLTEPGDVDYLLERVRGT